MIDDWGIQHRYEDAMGEKREVSSSTVSRLRSLIGEPPGSPPVVVTRPDDRRPVGTGELALEDGTKLEVLERLPAGLPFGYHTFTPGSGGAERIIVSPGRCHLPAGWRAWGWAAQLYAVRSAGSWGIGDLVDLESLAAWSAREHGAGFVLVNPLHAVAPAGAQQASPYFPATRRFRNPIYLRVEEVPGAAALEGELDRVAAAGRALNSRRVIDRDEVWRLKRSALEAIWARHDDAEFDGWFDDQGPDLGEFATWCVLAERFGPSWREWPAELRHPADPAVARFRDANGDRVRFHAWLQWLTGRQLAGAAEHLAVIQDLPIGVDPNGADAWAWQDLLAAGATVGAPADEFNTRGQDWGLPPFVPWRLQHTGYQPFIDTVRATIAAAGGLRIDHVMGLFRLWWVPEGGEPSEGGYVRYPSEDLLDIVALESHRAGAPVVGEDLGTVEEGAREALAQRDILSYRLLWFEQEPPGTWPCKSMAAVTTHDLPTVAGLWTGSDLEAQRRLDLAPNEESTASMRSRLAAAAGLDDGASVEEAVEGAHRLIAEAPSVLLAATLDDAVAEIERPNIPGADGQRSNWCLSLPVLVDDLPGHILASRVATLLAGAVGTPSRRIGGHEDTAKASTEARTEGVDSGRPCE